MKVFREQWAVGERIIGVGVEAGGHGDEFWLELLQVGKALVNVVRDSRPGAERRDGVVETIFADVRTAAAGVAGYSWMEKNAAPGTSHDIFRAVAMVDIEIKDGDAFDASGQRVGGGDGDVVQVAKTPLDFLAHGVVSGWTHETEYGFAAGPVRASNRRQRTAGRGLRSREVSRVSGVEIVRDAERPMYSGRMARRMASSDAGGVSHSRGVRFGAEFFHRAGDARGTSGMPRTVIAGAAASVMISRAD